ncbi:hypothetical protein NSND_62723 [Nitrospira sp. ND1]|jgi:hypothetical protein|nr:hypothetical protein NSND_62723 [Nitrospira sp. ND1]
MKHAGLGAKPQAERYQPKKTLYWKVAGINGLGEIWHNKQEAPKGKTFHVRHVWHSEEP